MPILKRKKLALTFVTLCITVAAFAQTSALRAQLENSQSLSAVAPQSDQAGVLWAWRDNEGLALSHLSSKNSSKITGAFLQHRLSANGEVVAALEKFVGNETRADKSGLMLRWFASEGRMLGAHHLAWHGDDPLPQFALNHSGSHVMALQPATAHIAFLNQTAELLKEGVLFDNAPYSNERPAFLAADANHFYVLSQSIPHTTQQASAPALICFSLEGKEQWRRELQSGMAGNLAISPSGNWLLANRYEVANTSVQASTVIFDAQGRQHTELSSLFRAASFSVDEKSALLIDRRQVRCIDLPSREILWQSDLKSREEMFAAAARHSQTWLALVARSTFKQNRFVYEKARVRGWNSKGQQQFELAVAHDLIAPILVASPEAPQFLLAADGVLLQYKIFAGPQSKVE